VGWLIGLGLRGWRDWGGAIEACWWRVVCVAFIVRVARVMPVMPVISVTWLARSRCELCIEAEDGRRGAAGDFLREGGLWGRGDLVEGFERVGGGQGDLALDAGFVHLAQRVHERHDVGPPGPDGECHE
jgi:hypothetical protein